MKPYDVLLTSLAIDLVAIGLLAFGVYFRRHRRKDILLGFIGVNLGLFVVASIITDASLNLAAGLGLFGVLSVIRLRSSEIGQEEIGYFFLALVIGLLNGLAQADHFGRLLTLNVVIVAVMFVIDQPWVLRRHENRVVSLDVVHTDEAALRADLERRLGAEVTRVIVQKIDFVHNHMTVDVRIRRYADEPVTGAHFATGPVDRAPGDPDGGIPR
jgi:hypothetical protein